MEILLKLFVALLSAAGLVSVVILLNRKIARMADLRWQVLVRSLLYAVAFTPTAYHHAPNTIIAPLHLSTICGNLFYPYDYTVAMFVYGVALPSLCGWALISITLLFRELPRLR